MTTKKDPAVPTKAEIDAAQKEGVLDRVRESANTQDMDTLKGEEPDPKHQPRNYNLDGTNLVEPLLGMGLSALEAAIDPKKKDDQMPEETIGKLLILERNGQNRTAFVKLLRDRLGIKDIFKELPQAGGPDYTNDVSSVTKL
jgi:hypothetical protein